MERKIYVEAGESLRIAVFENRALCDFLPCEERGGGLCETIFKGRVDRVVNGMHAAFVDIGLEKMGFLPLAENSATVTWPKLQAGQEIMVQVKKEPAGTKGAFLTRDVTLVGSYVVFMPCNRYIGVSGRITDDGVREELKRLGCALSEDAFGLVMRASAAEADASVVKAELDELRQTWGKISHVAPTAHAPSALHKVRSSLDALLDDLAPRGVNELVINDSALADAYAARVKTRVDESLRLEKLDGFEKQLNVALGRRVWLESGGNLMIDACEAVTVIDVNTAKCIGRKDLESTVRRTNLEACGEIARQLRLRNLGGVIIIDMIDMTEESHRAEVLTALGEALKGDRVKTVVHGLTSLGLVEMTRKKTSRTLQDSLTTICPCCHGTGRQAERMDNNQHA